ncbi:MAG TPA: NIPSNAP family protein [Pirellulales bacterium]|nr:NIPSNAP family protein [Pirellulales bacterium]
MFYRTAIMLALSFASAAAALSAESDTRVFELRTYDSPPGKLDALHARFRDHTMRIFEKHGMTNIGYWTPIENKQNQLIYLLAFPSREAREKSWQAFVADPEWKKVQQASEVGGKLVDKVVSQLLAATDYSPDVDAARKASEEKAGGPQQADRVFELRTYAVTPGKLDALNARFRDHTMQLFKKHGMTNIAYWNLLPDQKGADRTLVYLLAHRSQEAAEKSFAAFRSDPDWIAARKSSEEKAGGSLTEKDGVRSLFLKPTDYSPLK